MHFLILLRVDRRLKEWEENILQHLGKVWNQLLGLENVTERQIG